MNWSLLLPVQDVVLRQNTQQLGEIFRVGVDRSAVNGSNLQANKMSPLWSFSSNVVSGQPPEESTEIKSNLHVVPGLLPHGHFSEGSQILRVEQKHFFVQMVEVGVSSLQHFLNNLPSRFTMSISGNKIPFSSLCLSCLFWRLHLPRSLKGQCHLEENYLTA